jgi:hypothetical protein
MVLLVVCLLVIPNETTIPSIIWAIASTLLLDGGRRTKMSIGILETKTSQSQKGWKRLGR